MEAHSCSLFLFSCWRMVELPFIVADSVLQTRSPKELSSVTHPAAKCTQLGRSYRSTSAWTFPASPSRGCSWTPRTGACWCSGWAGGRSCRPSNLNNVITYTEHITLNGSLTVLALCFLFYAQERLDRHSKWHVLYKWPKNANDERRTRLLYLETVPRRSRGPVQRVGGATGPNHL